MAKFADFAVKAGKSVINFIANQIKDYLKSEEFKKQMKQLISLMVVKVIDIVLSEKTEEKIEENSK